MNSVEDLVVFGKKLMERKLVAGPGGNTSIRIKDRIYISPSGFSLDVAESDDYVAVDMGSGKVIEVKEGYRPTSELSMHLSIYRQRDDVEAVIHAHPPLLIGLISGGAQVLPMTPDFVAYLDHVQMIDYIVPCGEELAQAVGEALAGCNCLAMVGHGAITLGTNLKEAYYRMEILEECCKTQLAAIIAGSPRILSNEEVEEIRSLGAEAYRQKLLMEGKG